MVSSSVAGGLSAERHGARGRGERGVVVVERRRGVRRAGGGAGRRAAPAGRALRAPARRARAARPAAARRPPRAQTQQAAAGQYTTCALIRPLSTRIDKLEALVISRKEKSHFILYFQYCHRDISSFKTCNHIRMTR